MTGPIKVDDGFFLMNRKTADKEEPALTFFIYGENGTGKTTISSSFPHSLEKKQLLVQIGEDGSESIANDIKPEIEIVNCENFEQIDQVITIAHRGYAIDPKTREHIKVEYSSIVFDSVTNLDFFLRQFLMRVNEKDQMNKNLWGRKADTDEALIHMIRQLWSQLKIPIVCIAHAADYEPEGKPHLNKKIPSLQRRTGRSLAAKMSYVWYTDTEDYYENVEKNGEVVAEKRTRFVTTIAEDGFYLTKCRRPKGMPIPKKVSNITYPKFKEKIIDRMRTYEQESKED